MTPLPLKEYVTPSITTVSYTHLDVYKRQLVRKVCPRDPGGLSSGTDRFYQQLYDLIQVIQVERITLLQTVILDILQNQFPDVYKRQVLLLHRSFIVDIANKRAVQQGFCFYPEIVSGLAFAFGIGDCLLYTSRCV